MKAFPGEIQRGKFGAILLTDAQEAWLREWFPVTENGRLIAASGLSAAVLHRFARKFGLTKSARGLYWIKMRQARKIKEKCEQNGWYDHLRQQGISQACLDGFRAYLKSDRYVNPLLILKKKNPRKYQQKMAERSEARKKLVSKERAKDLFGLPRATALHLPMTRYTTAHTSRRWCAKQRGYIVPDDVREGHGQRWVIYYDDQTQRSALFEANCAKAGFRVLELINKK